MAKSDPLDSRGLPQSIETERLILAAILKDTLDFRDCVAVLDASDFALEAHRAIYRHMAVLADGGMGIDTATVLQSLKTAQELETAGGISYVIDLDQGMPGLPRLDDYIRIVRDKSILRKTVYIADSIRNDAILERSDASELLGRAERMLSDLGTEAARASEFETMGEIILAAGGLDGFLKRASSFGVMTGFPEFDSMTGGMRPGQLWIIGADTGGGKSTFARNMLFNAAVKAHPGVFVALEMSNEEIAEGMISHAAQINTQILRRGIMIERDKIRRATNQLVELPFYVRDEASATIPKLHGILRRMKQEKGIEYAIIDYLQLMTPTGKHGTRSEEIGSLSRGLKLIAQDLKICCVALSQTTTQRKANGKSVRAELTDLRESGSLEQDADLVAFIFSEWQPMQMEWYPAEVIIAKQRGGPKGSINFLWNKSTGSFRECAKETEN